MSVDVPRYPVAMTRLTLALVLTASALGCRGDATAPTPPATPDPVAPAPVDAEPAPAAESTSPAASAVDRATPEIVARAYFAAASAVDLEGMLALMTPEYRERERTWSKGFTKNIADGKIRLKSYEMREPEVTGDTAKLSVRAIFSVAVIDGEDGHEAMHFELVREAGQWSISSLK